MGRKKNKDVRMIGAYAAVMWLVVALTAILMGPADCGLLRRRPADAAIARAVKDRITTDPYLFDDVVTVTVASGVVTVAGTVDNILARTRAVPLARSVVGVRAVINRIDVAGPDRDDDALAKDVRSALAYDPVTEPWKIGVEAQSGMVVLRGRVQSWQERRLAGMAARSVRGVRALENRIMMIPAETRPDGEIGEEVRRRMDADPYIGGIEHITVRVDSGVVTLAGQVGSAAERARAVYDSRVAGVDSVDAGLLEVTHTVQRVTGAPRHASLLNDHELERAIRDAFAVDPRIPADSRVTVRVRDGGVTLEGVARSAREAEAVRQDAANTVGVWKHVVDRTVVRPGTRLSPRQLAGRVRERFEWDPLLKDGWWSVAVNGDTVLLSGTAPTPFLRLYAGRAASMLAGVSAVRNGLVVAGTASGTGLADRVEDALAWDVRVDADDILVTADSGAVTLAGSADSWMEYRAAVTAAFEAGAAQIRCRMTVEGVPLKERTFTYDDYFLWQ